MKRFFLISVVLATLLFSCSDAEIISGIYHGKIYSTDTLDANVKITKVNDGIVRLDLTGPNINGGYVEYAQLSKNAANAYNLKWIDNPIGFIELSGYYYEGYLSFNSWTNQYKFNGLRE